MPYAKIIHDGISLMVLQCDLVNVSISIYSSDGKLVRVLDIGSQLAGLYLLQNRAAYWDGNNDLGELVSGGVYFIILEAGDFIATRKMVIRK